MKKRTVVSLILAIVMMFALSATAFSAESADAPVLDVAAKNLSLNNTIDLVFYVTIENGTAANIKLMTWSKAQDDYAYGTQEQILEPTTITTYKNKPCAIFYYTGIAAKQMADNIYVRAYVEKGGEMYFSGVDKYSILQYAYNKINAATPDAKLVAILDSMLDYGAQAQVYFNYNTAHPANADFRLVKLANGALSDQTDRGLFLVGETATLIAPATNAAGVPFSYWKNSAGERVATTATFNLTVTVADTYEAVYEIPSFQVNAVNGKVDGVTGGMFKDKAEVTLVADEPAEGYVFSHWTNAAGATVGSTATMNVVVTGNETYTANYKIASYAIDVVNGTGAGTYEYGATATLVANAPAANYVFDNWTNAAGAVVGTDATITVTVTGAETYTANYKLASYTIDVVNGTGAGTYEYGATATLVANAPAANYEFANWTNAAGEIVGTDATVAVTVTGAETYTANYKLVSYAIDVVNGTGAGTYEYGATATLVANAPEANYVFTNWTNAAGEIVGTDATITVTVIGAETYTANYKLDKFTVNVVNGTGSGSYEYGATVTLVADAAAVGTEFGYWVNAAGDVVGTTATLEITVAGNETYTAVYNDLFNYTLLGNGTYAIALKSTTAVDGTIAIPAAYKGVAVTAIAENGFANRTDLTSIVIPENITVIGKNAFAGCTALESLTFAKTSYWSAGALEFAPSRAGDASIMAEFITGTYANKEWTYSAKSSEGSFTKPY